MAHLAVILEAYTAACLELISRNFANQRRSKAEIPRSEERTLTYAGPVRITNGGSTAVWATFEPSSSRLNITLHNTVEGANSVSRGASSK
jgi:hypothetical protein